MQKFLSLFLLSLLLLSGATFAASRDDEFLAAREAFRLQKPARLDAAAARLKGHVLEPYLAYWKIEMRLKDASPGEIRQFIQAYRDTPLSERLRADWLKLVARQQNWALFLSEYPSFVGEDDELTCYALQARLNLGDGSVFDEARRLWFVGTDQPSSCTPLFEAMMTDGLLKADDVWARIRLALELGNVSVAQRVAQHLSDQQEARLRTLDGIAENPQRFLDKGSADLKTRVGRELTIFALYRLARSQPQQALPYWDALRERFGSEDRKYVWGQMAFHAARKHDPAALKWFAEAGDTPLNELQHAWRVRAALRGADWQQVLAGVDAMPESMRRQGAWRYWKARALKEMGKQAQANAILAPLSTEHNFYGQMATEELGAVIGNPEATYRPSEAEVKAMGQVPGIRRALALYQLGLRLEANREWGWAIRNFDDKQLLVAAEVAKRSDWLDRAIYTAGKTVQLHDFSLRYPAPHRDLMRTFAHERNLDEAWIYGLIRQESRFIQVARSSVGASGLMQLMPGTAQWVAKRLGLKNFRRNLVNRLDTNIALGTYYLKYVLDVNDGQPVLATAAYNAGPVRAKRWKDEKALEGAVYTETIPFTETRDYVQKVMSNATYYANRFGQRLLTLKQRLGVVAGRNGGRECQAQDERSPSCEP